MLVRIRYIVFLTLKVRWNALQNIEMIFDWIFFSPNCPFMYMREKIVLTFFAISLFISFGAIFGINIVFVNYIGAKLCFVPSVISHISSNHIQPQSVIHLEKILWHHQSRYGLKYGRKTIKKTHRKKVFECLPHMSGPPEPRHLSEERSGNTCQLVFSAY